MRTSDGLGRVYRRCGCRDEGTGKQFGVRCERLADLSHGRWYFSLQVPGVDGGRDRDDEHEAVWRETGVRPRVAVWDLDNLARFLEAVRDDPLFLLWWLVALRGPRRGEMAGLRWEDINLAAGELTIREQVIVIGRREHLGPPKSAAGVRTLALDEATVKLLWELWHEQRRRRGGVDPKGRVFVHANGRPVSPDWLTRRFAKLVKQLGLPPVRLHDC